MKDREAWTEWATRRRQRHEEREATAIGSRVSRTGDTVTAHLSAAQMDADVVKVAVTIPPKPIVAGTLLYPLIALCRLHGLPEPRPEYAWHPTRRYRADYALVAERILIEVDGGLWIQGGHSRGAARLHDMEKDREATMLGFRTLRYPPAAESQIVTDLKRMLA